MQSFNLQGFPEPGATQRMKLAARLAPAAFRVSGSQLQRVVIRRQSVLDLEDEEIAIPMLKRLTEAEYRHAIFPDRPFGPIPDVADDVQWDTIHLLFGQATLRAQAYEDALARFVIAAE